MDILFNFLDNCRHDFCDTKKSLDVSKTLDYLKKNLKTA